MLVISGLQDELISIHSLRVEGDLGKDFDTLVCVLFQSTPSVWRETVGDAKFFRKKKKFQSTPSVWRETVRAISLKHQ